MIEFGLQRVHLLPARLGRADQRRKINNSRQQIDARQHGQGDLQILPGLPQIGHQWLPLAGVVLGCVPPLVFVSVVFGFDSVFGFASVFGADAPADSASGM